MHENSETFMIGSSQEGNIISCRIHSKNFSSYFVIFNLLMVACLL